MKTGRGAVDDCLVEMAEKKKSTLHVQLQLQQTHYIEIGQPQTKAQRSGHYGRWLHR